MVSETEAAIYDIFFSQLPPHGNLEDYSISQESLQESLDSAGIELDDVNWLELFHEDNIPEESRLKLDIDRFLDRIAEGLDNPDWLTDAPTVEHARESVYHISLPLKKRGETVLRVFTDGEEIRHSNPSIYERRINVWTIEPTEIPDETFTFSWRRVADDQFLPDICSELDNVFNPRTASICSLDSPAVSREPEGVEDSVKFFASNEGLQPGEDPDDVVRAKVSNYIDNDQVSCFIECEGGWGILCKCDLGGGDLHLHYTTDGSPADVSNCSNLISVQEQVRDKVKRYNRYLEQKKDILPAAKTAGYVLGVGGLIQALPIAFLISEIGIDADSDMFTFSASAIAVLYTIAILSLLWFLLSAHVKFRMMSWEKDGYFWN